MPRTTALALRASAVLGAALLLASCAQPGAAPTAAPPTTATPAPTTQAPTASAPEPTPSTTAEPDTAGAFEAQDGAVRFVLPEGWSIDDRSAMGEASEMYDRGPGWLNDLIVLDEDGDQMLWYRERYGNDTTDCREVMSDAVRTDIQLFSDETLDERAAAGDPVGASLVLAEAAESTRWDAMAQQGAWSVSMQVMTTLDETLEGCSDLTDVLWTGERAVWVDVVGDAATETGEPDTTLDFADEPSARAWLQSAEAAAITGVLESMRLTAAPVLDAAP